MLQNELQNLNLNLNKARVMYPVRVNSRCALHPVHSGTQEEHPLPGTCESQGREEREVVEPCDGF